MRNHEIISRRGNCGEPHFKCYICTSLNIDFISHTEHRICHTYFTISRMDNICISHESDLYEKEDADRER
jgi:hypothetical protein